MQWLVLLALSGAFALLLEALRLPAAFLLGPMAAAILVSRMTARTVRVPPIGFLAAQAVIGCMIARSIPVAVLGEILRDWPLYLSAVVSVIAASGGLGWLLMRWRILPGTTAIWGLSPGAATAMMVMADCLWRGYPSRRLHAVSARAPGLARGDRGGPGVDLRKPPARSSR